jgi:hypothetical protein
VRWTAVRALLLPLCVAPALAAQAPRPQGTVRPFARLDVIAATNSSLQVGAGMAVPAGTYVRAEVTAAAGAMRRHHETRRTGRVDVAARFVIDPFAESRRAVHAIGGLSAMHDGREWQPRLMAGIGVEGPARGAVRWSTELVVGGGLRVGIVARRSRPNRR